MKSFHEYPKMLVHPSSQAAQIGFEPMQGKPMTFPPVSVNNEDQEEQYKAKGYLVMGSPDASAYERVRSGGTPPHYKYEEYPKFIKVGHESVLATCKEHEHELLGYNSVKDMPKIADSTERKKPGRKPKTDRIHVE